MFKQPLSIKDINRLRVSNLLRLYPGISRTGIVNRTGLSKATVSSITSELIEQGVVIEVGTGEQMASAGRRPIRLQLNPQVRLAIGIELTGDECVATLTDLYSDPLDTIRSRMHDTSVESSIDCIIQSINQLLKGHDASKLLGVGLGVPGPVDAARQRVIQAENIDWFDVPLGEILTKHISQPVTVVKRQNAGVLGEYWHGIGEGQSNLLYISIGVGIGCGIIIHDELYEGTSGGAGEIGHMTIIPDGYRCRCGNSGCLETVSSMSAIAVLAREKAKHGAETCLTEWSKGALQSINGYMIMDAAKEGDALAIEIIQDSARYLGIAIANVINLFNPSKIIIGGEVMELDDLYLTPVREVVQRRSYSIPLSDVEIVSSSLGYLAAPIGAASLVIDQFFAMANPVF